ncbi:MAG TPA: extracellular solute-binding protein [Candidatus Limnocylindria bacterium]|nr:extracellular solute-binding protein [Candidatus Limnocylindria bacterium]
MELVPPSRLLGVCFALFGWVVSGLAANSLAVLTPHPTEVRIEFGRAFSKWHEARYGEPIQIEWRDQGGSSEDQRFVESEFKSKPDGIGIDVFFGGGPEPFLVFAERHLLSPWKLPADLAQAIPKESRGVTLYDSTGGWYGACLATFGILQNDAVQKLAKLPSAGRWEDLARPELFSWVGAGDPRNSGTMNSMYEAFLQAYGWEKGWSLLTRISGNVRQFDRYSTTTAKQCALGQVACAFAIDYYAFVQIASAGTNHMSYVLADDFTAMTPDGIAVLKGAPHQEWAERFVAFVLSEEGQKLWYMRQGTPGGPVEHALHRLPIRPDIYARYAAYSNERVNPFQLARDFRYDTGLSSRRRGIVRALFGACFIDVHPELTKAWHRLIERGLPAAEVAELGTMPLSSAEADQLVAQGWNQPASAELRQRQTILWQQRSLEKYRRLAQ